MAVSDGQKIDLLLKKVDFGVAKTDIFDEKKPTNETNSSVIPTFSQDVWIDDNDITQTYNDAPPSSDVAGLIKVRTKANGNSHVLCSEDGDATDNKTWKTGITNWISPGKYGANYAVDVYDGLPGLGGTIKLSMVGNGVGFHFDYEAGILNFWDDNVPGTVITNQTVYIEGWTYDGRLLAGNTIADLSGLDVISPISNLGVDDFVVVIDGGVSKKADFSEFQSLFSSTFSDLTDTAAYSGAGKLAVINGSNNGIDFTSTPSVTSIAASGAMTAGDLTVTNSGGEIANFNNTSGSTDITMRYGYAGYGWVWTYEGSGSGNDNKHILTSEVSGGTQVYEITQDGKMVFAEDAYFDDNVSAYDIQARNKLIITGGLLELSDDSIDSLIIGTSLGTPYLTFDTSLNYETITFDCPDYYFNGTGGFSIASGLAVDINGTLNVDGATTVKALTSSDLITADALELIPFTSGGWGATFYGNTASEYITNNNSANELVLTNYSLVFRDAADECAITYTGASNLLSFGDTNLTTTGNIIANNITGTLLTASQTAITEVGALNSGSITSGFGSINNGSSSITTTGLITADELTLTNSVQDWKFTGRSYSLILEGQTSNVSQLLEIKSKDSDGTDYSGFRVYRQGDGTASYDLLDIVATTGGDTANNNFDIITLASGHILSSITLQTGSNTDQLKLNTDGTVSMSGTLTINEILPTGSTPNIGDWGDVFYEVHAESIYADYIGGEDAPETTFQGGATFNYGQYNDASGHVYLKSDDTKLFFGFDDDVSINFNGSDWIFNSENITLNDEIHFTNFDKYTFDNHVTVMGNITTSNTLYTDFIMEKTTDETVGFMSGITMYGNIGMSANNIENVGTLDFGNDNYITAGAAGTINFIGASNYFDGNIEVYYGVTASELYATYRLYADSIYPYTGSGTIAIAADCTWSGGGSVATNSHISSTSNPHSVNIDDVTPTTIKGDIIVENGANAVRLGVGTNTQVLTADSTQATGLKWADAASGGASSFTDLTGTPGSWGSQYNILQVNSSTDGLEFTNSPTLSSLTVTNKALVGNGTYQLPAFSFISDPDTGMYRYGTNSIGFATQGTRRLYINNSTSSFSTNVSTQDLSVNGGLIVFDGAVGTESNKDGSIIFGKGGPSNWSYVESEVGSLTGGYVNCYGEIRTFGKGSSAVGFADGEGSGYSGDSLYGKSIIAADGVGSSASGYCKTKYGGYNEYYGQYYPSNACIRTLGKGSFASGTAYGKGVMRDMGGEFGYQPEGTMSKIFAKGEGSFAQGSAYSDEFNGREQYSGGLLDYTCYGANIYASGIGSFAQGRVKNSHIKATGSGSFAQGYANYYGRDIYSTGKGSFAQGFADTGTIKAGGENSVQFGPGINNVDDSLQVGSSSTGVRLEAIGGRLKGGNGTALLPAFSFLGDTNTGMWRSTTDTLNFSTGGAERLEIDSVGANFAVPVATTGTMQAPTILTNTINTIGTELSISTPDISFDLVDNLYLGSYATTTPTGAGNIKTDGSIIASGSPTSVFGDGSNMALKIAEGSYLQIGSEATPTHSWMGFGDGGYAGFYEKYDDGFCIAAGGGPVWLSGIHNGDADGLYIGWDESYSEYVGYFGDISSIDHGNYIKIDTDGFVLNADTVIEGDITATNGTIQCYTIKNMYGRVVLDISNAFINDPSGAGKVLDMYLRRLYYNDDDTIAMDFGTVNQITFKGTINLNDTSTQIYESSSNLTFKDSVTGVKTLAQLISGQAVKAIVNIAAPHGSTITSDIGTITCLFADGSSGNYLDEAVPRLKSGDAITVADIGGTYYCTTIFQKTITDMEALMPRLIYISGATLSESVMTNLSDATNWNTDNAVIKAIKVRTDSTSWKLEVWTNDAGSNAGMYDEGKNVVAQSLSGDQVLLLDLPYIDNDGTKEVHVRFYDTAGDGATHYIDIYGMETKV